MSNTYMEPGITPHNIQVNGAAVSFDGDMSKRTFDTINARNLVSHTVIGETPYTLHCTSADAAAQVAALLAQNPNYSR